MVISNIYSFKLCDAILLADWAQLANISSRNLGFEKKLLFLSSEQWQMVLTSVMSRMKMRGIHPPFGWKTSLADYVGRTSD